MLKDTQYPGNAAERSCARKKFIVARESKKYLKLAPAEGNFYQAKVAAIGKGFDTSNATLNTANAHYNKVLGTGNWLCYKRHFVGSVDNFSLNALKWGQ